MSRKECGLIVILGILPVSAVAAEQFQVVPLFGTAGSSSSTASGVSASGTVGAGLFNDAQGLSYGLPTLWQGQQPTLLPLPAGDQGIALSVNNSGVAVGVIHVMGSYDPRPVVWQNGQLQSLDTAGLSAGVPNSINNAGVIAGQIYDVNGPSHGALWNDGQLTILNDYSQALAVNDSGQVLVADASGEAIWNNGTVTEIAPLGPAGALSGHGMNNLGHVVGDTPITGASGDSYGFIWKDGATIALPSLPADTDTYALAVNDNDQIVGDGYSSDGGVHALFWDGGQVFDLNDLIPSGSGWTLYEATDITNDGTIVGYGSFNGQMAAFELTPTSSSAISPAPEPATVGLLLLGGTLLLARRQRKP